MTQITLQFRELQQLDMQLAEWMLRCARAHAEAKPAGLPGPRRGSLYALAAQGGPRWRCHAHWTRARQIVVTELAP